MRRGSVLNNANSIYTFMGKRLVLLIVIFASIVGFSGLQTAQGPTIRVSDLYTLHTQAQGFSRWQPNGVASYNDSVMESPTLVPHTIAYPVIEPQTLDVWVTAYSSRPEETDDTPFITASGTYVREGVAAANFLPIGTKFRVPDVFGDKVFTVEDRMNSRYNDVQIVDIWFGDHREALSFGKKSLTIELL
jgi:3D (Asp-Asp-Asp) domain-containing protein